MWICNRIDYSCNVTHPTLHETKAGAVEAGEIWVAARPEERGYTVHEVERVYK